MNNSAVLYRWLVLSLVWLGIGSARAQEVDTTFHLQVERPSMVEQILGCTDGSGVVGTQEWGNSGSIDRRLIKITAQGKRDEKATLRLNTLWHRFDRINLLAPLRDGAMLLSAIPPNGYNPQLIKVDSQGEPDPSFALPADSSLFVSRALEQGDGRILIVARNKGKVQLRRLLPNGQLEAGFRITFKAERQFDETINALVLDSQQRILVAGEFTAPDTSLVRLLPTGELDTSLQLHVRANHEIYELDVQPDGKLLIQVDFWGQQLKRGVKRLLADGRPDASFSMSSSVKLDFGSVANRVIVRPNGRILLLTQLHDKGKLVQLLPNGDLDATFEPGAIWPVTANALEVFANGSMWVGGFYNRYPGPASSLVRLDAQGRLDQAFSPPLWAPAIVYQIKHLGEWIYAHGDFTRVAGYHTPGLLRLTSAGKLDTAFMRRLPQLAGLDYVRDVAQQHNNRVVLAGNFNTPQGASLPGAIRLLPTGELDETFSCSSVDPKVFFPTAVFVLPDDKILLGGTRNTNSEAGLRQLFPDGELDASFYPSIGRSDDLVAINKLVRASEDQLFVFSSKGLYRIGLGESNDIYFHSDWLNGPSIAAQFSDIMPFEDGYVVAGRFPTDKPTVTGTLRRLTANGFPMDSFQDVFSQLHASLFTVEPGPAGRFYVGGTSQNFLGQQSETLTLALVEKDGYLDEQFKPVEGKGILYDLLNLNGVLYAVGSFGVPFSNGNRQHSLIRLKNVNGSPLATATAKQGLQLKLAPNPAREAATVHWAANAKPTAVLITDLLGRTIQRVPVLAAHTSHKLCLTGLAAGPYLVRLEGTTGVSAGQRLVIMP